MTFKIKHAEKIVGVFILFAAALLVAAIVFLGANQRWFSRDYTYLTRFNTAVGSDTGTPITLNGFTIGKVTKLTLNSDNFVDAKFVIYGSYFSRVHKDSVLEKVISPLGLGTSLLFHPGLTKELLPEGGFVPVANSSEGQWLIAHGRVNIPAKTDTISQLLTDFNGVVTSLGGSVANVNTLLVSVQGAIKGDSTTALGNTLRNAAMVSDHLVPLAISLEAIANNLTSTSEQLKDTTGLIPRLLDSKGSVNSFLNDDNRIYNSILTSMDSLQKTLLYIQQISQTLNSSMPTVTTILDESKTAIVSAQDVLEGLRNNPLLKGGISKAKVLEPLNQSMREGDF